MQPSGHGAGPGLGAPPSFRPFEASVALAVVGGALLQGVAAERDGVIAFVGISVLVVALTLLLVDARWRRRGRPSGP